MIEIIGFTAAILSTVTFLPQVVKTWKSRSAKDLSLSMYLLVVSSVFMWLVYGILKVDWPIILANIVTLSLSSIILYFKIRYK
ncbi:MAG: SemiSWEET transporter [Bacteroidia bacterium]|nr:SemiSWEET transporter [Bacteroidia bacterium]